MLDGAVSSLVAMGFTEEQATIALQSSAGDVSRAINLLLEQTTAHPPAHHHGRPEAATVAVCSFTHDSIFCR